CYAGDADPLLDRLFDPVPELAADYWVMVHRDLRRAACVGAVMGWIRGLFDQHCAALAGTTRGPAAVSDLLLPSKTQKKTALINSFLRKEIYDEGKNDRPLEKS